MSVALYEQNVFITSSFESKSDQSAVGPKWSSEIHHILITFVVNLAKLNFVFQIAEIIKTISNIP